MQELQRECAQLVQQQQQQQQQQPSCSIVALAATCMSFLIRTSDMHALENEQLKDCWLQLLNTLLSLPVEMIQNDHGF